MTIVVTSIWGGRVAIVVDRQISRSGSGQVAVVDTESTKVCAVLTRNALLSVSYTGIALANGQWMDEAIADCLAFRTLDRAMVQPGSFFLARPTHEVIDNLCRNLALRIQRAPLAAKGKLTLNVSGWHLRPRLTTFAWECEWLPSPQRLGGQFRTTRHKVAKRFGRFCSGMWLQCNGDTNQKFEAYLRNLDKAHGLSHDDVERFVVAGIRERAAETDTVGSQCLALQLDPRDREGHVQFTYYPTENAADPQRFLTGWVMTPTLIQAPSRYNTNGADHTTCGRYVEHGFYDPQAKLAVRTRMPAEFASYGGRPLIFMNTEARALTPNP